MTRVAAAGVVLAAALAVSLPRAAEAQQVIGGCPVLPANNIWNTPIDTLPVLSNSGSMVTTIGASTGFHADFGAGMWDGGPIGIPFITVAGPQTKYPGDVPVRGRERSRPVRRAAERADRRRQQLHRRPPCDRDRHDQLHPLRAVQRVPAGVELERRLRRHLRSEVERAASRGMDVGRRRGPADHARPRHLRRGAERRDQARDPLHRAAVAPRVTSGPPVTTRRR